jgi:hypothetical protein
MRGAQRLWSAYRHDQPLDKSWCDGASDRFYLAVLSLARGAAAEAAVHARAALRLRPGNRVYAEAATYLERLGRQGRGQVYSDPAGFAAFIRGGGNTALYRALSHALRRAYAAHRPRTLLDVGVGDGLALLPALTPDVGRVDLVEPSRPMLARTAAALRRRGIAHRTAGITAQQLARGQRFGDAHWELAQSTFALHNLSTVERHEVLSRLRRRTDRILLAEFDVRPGRSCEPDWVNEVVERYEVGLAEYEGGLVAQGFLMPVMFGYFDPAVTHREQPIGDWAAELTAAGFTVQGPPQLLHDYWWAPGYLVEAC